MKPLVYITGAGGYLGSSIIKKFLYERDYNLLISFDDINETINDGIKADVVIHLAAKLPSFKGDPNIILETNLEATKKIVETRCKEGAHFIFLSTDYVFKSDENVVHYENDIREPETVYGESKALAEDYLLNQNKLDVTILRPSMLYGYNHPKRTNFFKFLHDKVSNNEEVELFTDVYSRPTHVQDVNYFIDKVIKERLTGVIHACGADYVNRYDLGKLFCESNGFNSDLLVKTQMPKDGRWPSALNLGPSTIFIDSLTTTLKEGIAKCLKEF